MTKFMEQRFPLVKPYQLCYGTPSFVTVFARDRVWTKSRVGLLQSTPSHPV